MAGRALISRLPSVSLSPVLSSTSGLSSPLSTPSASPSTTAAVARSGASRPCIRRRRSTILRRTGATPNWSNWPPKETILLDGCDFEHWFIVMEPPDPSRSHAATGEHQPIPLHPDPIMLGLGDAELLGGHVGVLAGAVVAEVGGAEGDRRGVVIRERGESGEGGVAGEEVEVGTGGRGGAWEGVEEAVGGGTVDGEGEREGRA